ncbi:MAG TPA: glycoside hydrolase family 75 protein [Polyangia bacterium]
MPAFSLAGLFCLTVGCSNSAGTGGSGGSSGSGGSGGHASGGSSGGNSSGGSNGSGGQSSQGGSGGSGPIGSGGSGGSSVADAGSGGADAGNPDVAAGETGPSDGGGNSGLGGMVSALGTITGSPAIAQLLALTKDCTATNKIASDTGLFASDNGMVSHVCALKGGPGNVGGAVYYTADMDIDCDGLTTTHCPGTGADKDPAYDDTTSFHGPHSGTNAKGQALASENTPYVVIPEEVVYPGVDQNNGGNIVAVIYKDQIEFAVFGDQIAYQPGDKSEPIGEASVRTANGLGIPPSPASGGVGSGVTYIVFAGAGSQPADMENIPEIQSLGAQLTESLLKNNP